MKKCSLILALFIVAAAPSVGQTRSDSTAQVQDTQSRTNERIVDEDGNGVDDRAENRARGSERRKDRFIDKDGDGICDGREAGLGFGYGHGAGRKGGVGSGQKRAGHGGKR